MTLILAFFGSDMPSQTLFKDRFELPSVYRRSPPTVRLTLTLTRGLCFLLLRSMLFQSTTFSWRSARCNAVLMDGDFNGGLSRVTWSNIQPFKRNRSFGLVNGARVLEGVRRCWGITGLRWFGVRDP